MDTNTTVKMDADDRRAVQRAQELVDQAVEGLLDAAASVWVAQLTRLLDEQHPGHGATQVAATADPMNWKYTGQVLITDRDGQHVAFRAGNQLANQLEAFHKWVDVAVPAGSDDFTTRTYPMPSRS